MILTKLIISLSFLLIFNGCAQNAAFLGPAITGASTGSIYNASLSYGSGKVIEKATGKTTVENLKSILQVNKVEAEKEENYEDFFDMTQSLIDKNNGISDLSNQ